MYVHYPFHPLHGHELRVFTPARSLDGAVTVEETKQKRLKIPVWMVAAKAAHLKVTNIPTVDARALLQLVELCESNRGKLSASRLHPTTEPSHEATLVDHTARPRIDTED